MKKEFLIDRSGKQFALYAGLLDQAHEDGLTSITTTLIQPPSPDNGHTAICYAQVKLERDGREYTFTGIGDASPDNVARMMVPHIIRMAETRAKARALRDAINVGIVALEELAEEGDESGHQAVARAAVEERASVTVSKQEYKERWARVAVLVLEGQLKLPIPEPDWEKDNLSAIKAKVEGAERIVRGQKR